MPALSAKGQRKLSQHNFFFLFLIGKQQQTFNGCARCLIFDFRSFIFGKSNYALVNSIEIYFKKKQPTRQPKTNETRLQREQI